MKSSAATCKHLLVALLIYNLIHQPYLLRTTIGIFTDLRKNQRIKESAMFAHCRPGMTSSCRHLLSKPALLSSLSPSTRCLIPPASDAITRRHLSNSPSPSRNNNGMSTLIEDKERGLGFARSNACPKKPRDKGVTEIRGPYYAVMLKTTCPPSTLFMLMFRDTRLWASDTCWISLRREFGSTLPLRLCGGTENGWV